MHAYILCKLALLRKIIEHIVKIQFFVEIHFFSEFESFVVKCFQGSQNVSPTYHMIVCVSIAALIYPVIILFQMPNVHKRGQALHLDNLWTAVRLFYRWKI